MEKASANVNVNVNIQTETIQIKLFHSKIRWCIGQRFGDAKCIHMYLDKIIHLSSQITMRM